MGAAIPQPAPHPLTSHTHTHPPPPTHTYPHTPAGSGALVDYGVHAFVVPLRDEAGRCLPGVEIHDCGYKVGGGGGGGGGGQRGAPGVKEGRREPFDEADGP
jgi:hypothetical protein